MTTIQRRIAQDIIVTFCFSLLVITVLVMFIGVMREAFNQGLGIVGVIRLIPFALPNALSLAVPGTALFSVCCVYGRMSSDNEITAIQSVGISPLPAMLPAVFITAVLSLVTVGLINVSFTWGFHGIEKVVMSSVERIAYGVLQRDHRFQHGELSLVVRDVDGKELIEPIINLRRVGREPVTINANSAKLRYEDSIESIQLSVTNGSAIVGDRAAFHFPDTLTHVIPLNATPPYDLLTAHPSHMPMRDLPKASIRQQQDIRSRESMIVIHAGFNLLVSCPDEIVGAAAQEREGALESSRKRLHRLDTEMHRRWASGFTCLAMSMIGIPLAIRLKAADTMTTFGIVFLPTVIVYYPIFALTLDLAKDGILASQGVWIANLLFILVSVVMMRNIIYKPA